MPETKSAKPAKSKAQPEPASIHPPGEAPTAHRKPATHHGMEEYEEVFRRTDNPYQRINPHWPNGNEPNQSQR